eukprot:COSAG01_NODE_10817_length_2074_cov_3.884557_2_plen_182_part_00
MERGQAAEPQRSMHAAMFVAVASFSHMDSALAQMCTYSPPSWCPIHPYGAGCCYRNGHPDVITYTTSMHYYGRRRQQANGTESNISTPRVSDFDAVQPLSETDLEKLSSNFTSNQRRQLQSGRVVCRIVEATCDLGDLYDVVEIPEVLVGTFTGGVSFLAQYIAGDFFCRTARDVTCSSGH